MQFLRDNLTFLYRVVCIYRKNLVSQDCFSELHVKIYENLNFITDDKKS